MMRIIFAVKTLGSPSGGAERVLCLVASGLASRGHEVAVVVHDKEGVEPFYPLDPRVKVFRTGIGHVGRRSRLLEGTKRLIACRRLISKLNPDVVVGFMHSTYIPLGIALVGTGVPVIASEHSGPKRYLRRPLQRLLLQLTPVLTRRITVVSGQIKQSFGSWLSRIMVVMPNPVTVCTHSGDGTQKGRPVKVLLSVGSLKPEKGHKTLIAAFGLVANRHPNWILRIAGEGELREVLQQQVEELGLASHVQMPGVVKAIDDEYRAADLFVLPSIYESFGLATAEALLHGLPAVGFADCAGTNELIVDHVNGRLVTGEDRPLELSLVLDQLMGDPGERQRLGSASKASLLKNFSLEGVLDKWESLLADVTRGSSHRFDPPGSSSRRVSE